MRHMSPLIVPIAIVGMALTMPVVAILVHSIPGTQLLAAVVILALAYQIRKGYEARLRHGAEASRSEQATLRRKVADMEDRLATLQEIVIGEYDTKRAIERVQAASRSLHQADETPVQPQEKGHGQQEVVAPASRH